MASGARVGPTGLKITAEPGDDVTLRCKAPEKNKEISLEWSRRDLVEENVFSYRSHGVHLDDQHESFRNRVSLKDSQMKDGDLSVVLKNVTMNDNGTYECKIRQENDPQGSDFEQISSVDLSVDPPGTKDGGGEMKELKNISAESGQDVTLPCFSDSFKGWEWSKYGDGRKNLFQFYDGQIHPEDQHESFWNRAFLKDSQMKNGDLSVVLKSVTIEDSGRYDCSKFQESNLLRELISSVDLSVDPPGLQDEDKWNPYGLLALPAVALVALVGFCIYKKIKEFHQRSRRSNIQQNLEFFLTNSNTEHDPTNPDSVVRRAGGPFCS